MKTLTSLLVGAHFRPPAKQVLALLPSGAPLLLVPQDDNPYDEHALQVQIWPSAVPVEMHEELETTLSGTGSSVAELLALEEPLQLGFVAATGGKPLAKAGLTIGNQEFRSLLAQDPSAQAKLAFGPAGEPMVTLTAEAAG